ncbi:hypothetical protein KY335_05405 [Candidatus Woesearchaeota archaeon]|nr:hypothetical protein [Candidatus Woesearchaeota archaeon]
MVSIHGRFGLRSWASMLLGAALVAIGLIPLLFSIGRIGFTIPSLPAFAFRIILIIAGVLLLWDATHEVYQQSAWMWLSVAAGIPILILGLIPVLNQYGIIGFNLEFISITILNILTIFAGIVLFIDAWKAE